MISGFTMAARSITIFLSLAPALLAVFACSSAGPSGTPQVRIDSLPPAAAEEPAGNLLASVTVTARPEELVVDGDLSEWLPFPDPVPPAGPPAAPLSQPAPKRPVAVPSSRLAIAITPAGLALAGELSPSLAEGFWLTILLDVPELPSIGKWVSPGAYFPLYCSGDLDMDELVECKQLLENHYRLAAEHAARFEAHYRIRPSGVAVHRDGALTPVEGAQVEFRPAAKGHLEGSAAGAVQRDGEVIAFAKWALESEERETRMARWEALAIGADGAHREDILDPASEADSIVGARHTHAADFSTLTITGRRWDPKKSAAGPAIEITWTWDPKARRYKPRVSPPKK